eukprot:277398-Rhodomonas_salina.5
MGTSLSYRTVTCSPAAPGSGPAQQIPRSRYRVADIAQQIQRSRYCSICTRVPDMGSGDLGAGARLRCCTRGHATPIAQQTQRRDMGRRLRSVPPTGTALKPASVLVSGVVLVCRYAYAIALS